MRLSLKDVGFSYKAIMQGRNRVGRVVKCADGRYLGIIDKHKCYADTERQAFDDVAAAFFGFSSVEALDAHNSRVAVQNREKRAQARYAVDQMLGGNFEPLADLLKI